MTYSARALRWLLKCAALVRRLVSVSNSYLRNNEMDPIISASRRRKMPTMQQGTGRRRPGGPRTIYIVSDDTELTARVASRLAHGERVVRLSTNSWGRISLERDVASIVVVDARSASRAETEHALVAFRQLNGPDGLLVVLTNIRCAHQIDVITRIGGRVHDVIIEDHDDIPLMLRAILNDTGGALAAAFTQAAVGQWLGPLGRRLAGHLLGSEWQLESVADLERVTGNSRGALSRRLRQEGSPGPRAILRLVKATYAIMARRGTSLSLQAIAIRLGYSAPRWVRRIIMLEFGSEAQHLMERPMSGDLGTVAQALQGMRSRPEPPIRVAHE